jgi:hypothetical protein
MFFLKAADINLQPTAHIDAIPRLRMAMAWRRRWRGGKAAEEGKNGKIEDVKYGIWTGD